MRALTLDQGQLRYRSDYPIPKPGPGEALLRMRMAGICGTDLALRTGYKGEYRGVLGHEYVAEVVQAPGQTTWLGRRVVGEINTTCGRCERCQMGLDTHCSQRRVLGILNWDGVFADYFLSPVANLHSIPDTVADAVAVFTEPMAAAYAVLRDLPADAGERMIVFGAGRLGQLIALVLKQSGLDPLLIARYPNQFAVAGQFGIRTARAAPRGVEYDVAIDATGNAAAWSGITACLRPRGVLVLKTTTSQPVTLDMSAVVVNEWHVIGSRCGPFPQAIQALASGLIDPTPLITASFDLSQAVEAFEKAQEPGSLKVLLHP